MLDAPSAQRSAGVPDVVKPPPGNPRFPLFDSLRALAAVSILMVHAAIFSESSGTWFWPLVAHLDIGVPFFFLLSGFLLYRPMLAARILDVPATRLRTYARRRFLRIAPAYWVALTVLTLIVGLNGVFTSNWWVYYGLLSNYPVYTPSPDCQDALTRAFTCGIAPTWSLAIEVFFYLVLPFFAVAMAWLTAMLRRLPWLAIELAVLAVLSAFSIAIQNGTGSGHPDLYMWLFFSPLGRAWWFAVGMGLAAVSVWIQERGRTPRAMRWISENSWVPWGLAILLYLMAALFILDPGPSIAAPVGDRSLYVFQYVLVGVIAGLVLLPVAFGGERDGVHRRLLSHPTLSWLGLVSYGIFLWHFPIILKLTRHGVPGWWPAMAFPILVVSTLAITVVCAGLSYYLLERPLMRRK